MEKAKRNQRENLGFLRNYSLCVCMVVLGGIAFPMPARATVATELATQQKTKQITGVVSDEHGTPIVGANVIEMGTTNGVITDWMAVSH